MPQISLEPDMCCEHICFEVEDYAPMVMTDLPDYSGATTVTPSMDAQTLETANTALHDNITVEAIPYDEVEAATPVISVDSGGKVTATTNQQGGIVESSAKSTEYQQPTVEQATPDISVDSDGVITATATQTGGFVAGGSKTATLAQETVEQATPTISVDNAGKITASATQTAGFVAAGTKSAELQQQTVEQATPSISVANDGTVTAEATQTAGFVAAGTKSASYSLPTQAAAIITPTESAQTAVTAGKWTTGDVQVGAIPSDYFKPSGTLPIMSNGVVDVKQYASASVNVPGITPTGTLSISENGTYDVTNYAGADVNVAGGGGYTGDASDPIRFFDYDGTVVASYKTVPASMPVVPVHDGLTGGVWNYTLAEVQSQFGAMGTCDIGANYGTVSGATEIDLNLVEGNLHLYFYYFINGSGYIDWGDGSATETISGLTVDAQQDLEHTYQSIGKYTISVYVTSGEAQLKCAVNGTNKTGFISRSRELINANNRGMMASVTAVRIGQNMLLGEMAFYSFRCMEYVTIPFGISSIGTYCFSLSGVSHVTLPSGCTTISYEAFGSCYYMRSISMPSSVASIDEGAFRSCGLERVSIPNGVSQIPLSFINGCNSVTEISVPTSCTSIANYAFGSCSALSYLEIPASVTQLGSSASIVSSDSALFTLRFKSAVPPTAVTSGLNGLPQKVGLAIYVPEESVAAYKAATGFSTYAQYIYGE